MSLAVVNRLFGEAASDELAANVRPESVEGFVAWTARAAELEPKRRPRTLSFPALEDSDGLDEVIAPLARVPLEVRQAVRSIDIFVPADRESEEANQLVAILREQVGLRHAVISGVPEPERWDDSGWIGAGYIVEAICGPTLRTLQLSMLSFEGPLPALELPALQELVLDEPMEGADRFLSAIRGGVPALRLCAINDGDACANDTDVIFEVLAAWQDRLVGLVLDCDSPVSVIGARLGAIIRGAPGLRALSVMRPLSMPSAATLNRLHYIDLNSVGHTEFLKLVVTVLKQSKIQELWIDSRAPLPWPELRVRQAGNDAASNVP